MPLADGFRDFLGGGRAPQNWRRSIALSATDPDHRRQRPSIERRCAISCIQTGWTAATIPSCPSCSVSLATSTHPCVSQNPESVSGPGIGSATRHPVAAARGAPPATRGDPAPLVVPVRKVGGDPDGRLVEVIARRREEQPRRLRSVCCAADGRSADREAPAELLPARSSSWRTRCGLTPSPSASSFPVRKSVEEIRRDKTKRSRSSRRPSNSSMSRCVGMFESASSRVPQV